MARLRAAEDHAARDAARQAAGLRASRSCIDSSTSSSSEMGDAYPELGANTRRDRQSTSVSEEERFDAVLTRGLPSSRNCSTVRRRRASPVPGDEAFKLYDTLRPAARLHRGPGERAEAGLRSRELRRGDGRTAREGAGRERVRRKEGRRVRVRVDPSRQTLRAPAIEFEGYTTTTRQGRARFWRSSTTGRSRCDELASRAVRL